MGRGTLPAILPCSVSMQTQSKPQRAIVLDKCEPGSICQAPKDRPLPVNSALRRALELFMICAIAKPFVGVIYWAVCAGRLATTGCLLFLKTGRRLPDNVVENGG